MLAAYSTRRSSVVLNPRARVLAGLGDGDGGGDGGGFGFGDGGGADGTSTGSVGQGEGLGDGLTAANDAVSAQSDADAAANIDAVTQADAAAKAAAEADADAANVNAINLAISQADAAAATAQALGNAAAKGALSFLGLPGVVIGVLAASGLISAGVSAALSGNSSGASSNAGGAASAVGGIDITNAPASVKTAVSQVKDATAAVKTVMQYNNYDLTSPAYKRFLPENGGKGIPALYQEIRDFISTHNKAEIDQAMTASGVSNADVIAAFQAVGTSQPGSGTNLAFLAAIAASYFILGA